jgi:hypothetical protein
MIVNFALAKDLILKSKESLPMKAKTLQDLPLISRDSPPCTF